MIAAHVDYTSVGGRIVIGYVTNDGRSAVAEMPRPKGASLLGEYAAVLFAIDDCPDIQEIGCDCTSVIARLDCRTALDCPIHEATRAAMGRRKIRLIKGNRAHKLVRSARTYINELRRFEIETQATAAKGST